MTLESEFEKIKEVTHLHTKTSKHLRKMVLLPSYLLFQIDIDHWENKRGPRPWEMENTSQKPT